MDGRRDVALDRYRRTGGGPPGCNDSEEVHEIGMRVGLHLKRTVHDKWKTESRRSFQGPEKGSAQLNWHVFQLPEIRF